MKGEGTRQTIRATLDHNGKMITEFSILCGEMEEMADMVSGTVPPPPTTAGHTEREDMEDQKYILSRHIERQNVDLTALLNRMRNAHERMAQAIGN